MVTDMTSELQEQISGVVKAQDSSEKKIARIGASVSELSERLRAPEPRTQEREAKLERHLERHLEAMHRTVEQLREERAC